MPHTKSIMTSCNGQFNTTNTPPSNPVLDNVHGFLSNRSKGSDGTLLQEILGAVRDQSTLSSKDQPSVEAIKAPKRDDSQASKLRSKVVDEVSDKTISTMSNDSRSSSGRLAT